MERLKPCPFCGGLAGISELKKGHYPRFSVACFNSSCIASEQSAFGKKYYTRADAVRNWNRRTPNDH